jgi:biopolymer transport protein ExbD
MKYGTRRRAKYAEGDMTPMIDMTFQLIAFFMVLINFAEVDQDQAIRLPSSELAKPPDAPLETPITIQLTARDTVRFAGEEMPVEGLGERLMREREALRSLGKSYSAATVIIRADRSAKTGKVQEVIKVCQETGFEKFALRAKQEDRGPTRAGA